VASATQGPGHISRLPAFWIRRSVTLLLSPVGLLLISVTRLMIVADYNATTATTIASSGGYVNTILGTVVPLVPLFLPYLAIVLLIFRRFILGFMAFGAALLISPTRLAPLTAFNRLTADWDNTVALVKNNLALSIAALVVIIVIDLIAFRHTFGRLSLLAFALTLISVAFLLPYILYVYPIPRTGNYYAEFMRQPWLSAERIEVSSGISVVGYTLAEDDNWTTFLNASTRRVEYFRTSAVLSRQVCQVNSDLLAAPQSPLVPLLHAKPAKLPSCWPPTSRQAAAGQQERSETSAHRVSVSSRRFTDLTSLPPLNVCGSGDLIVTLSVELHGAPAGFRVRLDGTADLPPGAVRFDPLGAHDSFSFTFEAPAGPVSSKTITVQWRSPYGFQSHLERASVDARYADGSDSC
jgi:hypothetical protein